MGKRIFLFIVTNAVIVLTLTTVARLLGLEPYLSEQGLNFTSLAIFSALFGFGGAFISLLMSKWIAKKSMGVQIIDEEHQDPVAREIVNKVHQFSRASGLPKMPEVGIFNSPEPNAFATGPSKSNSLVAVSTGLLQVMDQDEVDGVLAHEVAHIANGDMVTMTLLQGIINSFAIFLARIVAFAIDNAMKNDRGEGGLGIIGYYAVMFVAEAFFLILGSLIVNKFSRYREFRADAGGARLAGREKMVSALQKLKATFDIDDPHLDSSAVKTMQIRSKSAFGKLFATHPPLEERIKALQGY